MKHQHEEMACRIFLMASSQPKHLVTLRACKNLQTVTIRQLRPGFQPPSSAQWMFCSVDSRNVICYSIHFVISKCKAYLGITFPWRYHYHVQNILSYPLDFITRMVGKVLNFFWIKCFRPNHPLTCWPYRCWPWPFTWQSLNWSLNPIEFEELTMAKCGFSDVQVFFNCYLKTVSTKLDAVEVEVFAPKKLSEDDPLNPLNP